jgi:PAS domain S-box-containing protein
MCRDDLCDFWCEYGGILKSAGRVAVYSAAVVAVLLQDLRWSSVDSSALAGFLVFSTVFELLYQLRGNLYRRAAYVVCVVALGIAGLFLAREATRVEAVAKARSAQNAAVRHLVGQMPEAVFALDADEVIRACNGPTRELTGYDPDELVGRPIDALYGPRGGRLACSLRPGESATFRLRRKDGNWVDVRASCLSLPDDPEAHPEDIRVLSLARTG